jgi:hypothetical protein
MTNATQDLTPIQHAGAATLITVRELVKDECADTVAKIDECLARLGITAVTFTANGEVL